MPRAVKGQRFGGRLKGVPNKATIERALLAERAIAEAKANAKPLAREVLDQFMQLFAGMAAHHQPMPAGQMAPPDRNPDETKFEKWARLAVQCAKDLAPYQSPTFRAIVVAPTPESPRGKITRFTLEIFDRTGRGPIKGANGAAGNGKVIEHEADAW
jgi:hypothetical protein